MSKRFSVEFYQKENGEIPMAEFLSKQTGPMKAKIAFTIDLLEEMGNGLREPFSKSLEDGILELRIKAGSDISRVFYFFMVGNRAILTHGFIKKTQKTPRKEIDKAKKYREDFLRRMQQ